MASCPICQAGLSEALPNGGRCPICGNMVAWPQDAGDPANIAHTAMVPAGFAPLAAPPPPKPAEDPVAALKQTLARIVKRAGEGPAEARGPQLPLPEMEAIGRSLLDPNLAPLPVSAGPTIVGDPPAAAPAVVDSPVGGNGNAAPHESHPTPHAYPTPRGNVNQTVELPGTQDDQKKTKADNIAATLDSDVGYKLPAEAADGADDQDGKFAATLDSDVGFKLPPGTGSDGAEAVPGPRKHPSTYDERRIAQTMDSADVPAEDTERIAKLWRGSVAPSSSPRTSLKGEEGSRKAHDSRLVIKNRAMRQPQEPPRTGTDYELLNVIGEGGMGVVYAARQASIDRTVAIKMLKADIAKQSDQREKFLSEAVVTGDLDHPNIVPIYDLGSNEAGALFYSMKRVQGTPWMNVVEKKSLHENIEVLMKVADAVAFAHSRGVIHRDLKPENVMLGDFGEVLVMDWGLAVSTAAFRKSASITQTSSMGGTPAYMAPEMATGPIDRVNSASDVYLLGAILYEVITGRPPHTGKNVMNCLFAAARNEIVPTDRSGELLDIARKAMATQQSDRYESVREFQTAIRTYQSHSESIVLSTRAETDLAAAEKSGNYQTFSRALFAFQEAFALWDGNTKAKQGISSAKLAYARQALSKEDYDLGASLLEATDPAHADLRRRIVLAQRERDSRQQRLKSIKRVAAGLAVMMLAVVGYAFLKVTSAKNKAVAAELEATDQKNKAIASEKDATEQKNKAVAAERDATDQKNKAIASEHEATKQKDLARAAELQAKADRDRAQQAKKDEQYQAYVARIGMAQAQTDENAFDTAEHLLDDCLPRELRNWEWGRLWHLATRSVRDFRCTAPVDSVAISSDGSQFVSGSWDGQARIWDVASGKTLLTIPYGGLYVHAVAFSPDGRYVATGGSSKPDYVKIWDAHTGKPVRSLVGHGDDVLSVAFSRDSRRLLTSSYDKTARLWDVETGHELQKYLGHNWWVWSAAFSADESRIVTASQDGTAIVWSTDTAQPGPPFTGHVGPVYAAAFSPDGRSVVSGGYDNRLLVWEPAQLKPFDYQAVASNGVSPPPQFRALEGHTAAIDAVAFSPDGHMILSAANDNTVKLWDFASGKLIKSLRGHAGRVRSAVFTPNGQMILSGGHDNVVKLWDIAGYEESRVLQGRELQGHADAVLSAAYSRDGRRIITASRDRTAKLWESATGKLLGTFEEGHEFLVSTAAFFPGGKRLLTAAGDNTARVWDVASGTQQLRLDGIGHGGVAVLSHNAKWILTASDELTVPPAEGAAGRARQPADKAAWTAKLWDASTGALLRSIPRQQAEVSAVAFSPDDQIFFTGDSEGRCSLWSTATAQPLKSLDSHTRKITAAAFTADGTRVLTASLDNTVGQWNVADGKEPLELILKHPVGVLALAVVPGSQQAFTVGDDGSVRLWNIDNPTAPRLLDTSDGTNQVDVSADGRLAMWVNYKEKTVRLWDVPAGRQIPAPGSADPRSAFLTVAGGPVWSAAFSPDARYLVTVGGNGARLWEVATGGEQITFTPNGAVASASFSPDGQWVVTGSWDNSAKIWNVASGHAERKLLGHGGFVNSTRFMPGGNLVLTASDDRTARLWDAKTGDVVHEFSGHADRVLCAVSSPDGARILTGSADKTARIWDVKTGRVLAELKGHEWAVQAVAFSADGTLAVTGSADTTAKVWDAATGKLLFTLAGHTAPVTSVAFSPDGKRVVSGSQDTTAKLWDPTTGREILTLKGHTQEVTSVAFSPDGRNILTASRDGSAMIWLASDWRDAGQQ